MRGSAFAGPGDSPGFLLWQVTNRWQRAIRDALAPLGLTHVQFVLLACVTDLDGRGRQPTQRELADHAGTDEMMTSQVVRALSARELLTRTPDPADRRTRRLRPTAAGGRLAEQAIVVVEQADRAFFAAWGPDTDGLLTGLRNLSGGGTSRPAPGRGRPRDPARPR